MLTSVKELYKFRSLVWALTVRHLSMRYRGSVLGFLWSLLNPLCLMLVYTVVFQFYIRFNQVENYEVFLFCGLLPWIWFSSALLEGTSSIVSSGHLITKSMFPPQILPFVAVVTTMINFLLSLPLLFIFMLVLKVPLHASMLLLPVLIAAQMIFMYGLALTFGALNVQFRDVQHILANLLTLLFFLCPIVYSADVVPKRLSFTMDLNPLALLTTFYHDLIMRGVLPPLWSVVYFGLFVLTAYLVGTLVFERYRESFAELL